MKFNISLLLWFGFYGSCLSQPIITDQIMFAIGDSAPVQYFNQGGTAFDPGPAGAGVNWQFASVNKVGQPFSWQAIDPGLTPWASTFAQANLAVSLPNQDGEDLRYYRFENSRLEFVGWVSTSTNGILDTFVYDLSMNPALEIAFPFSYQQQQADTAQGKASIPVGGMSITVDRTIYRTLLADAYGTLTTPFGTFSDVLRLRMDERIEDRTFGQITSTQENRRYFWYQAGEQYLLMEMDSLVLQNAGGTFPSTSMFYRSGEVITHISEAVKKDALRWWIDYSKAALEVRLTHTQAQKTAFHLRSLTGHTVKSFPGPLRKQTRLSIPLHQLPSGIYVLQGESKSGSISKLIKIP